VTSLILQLDTSEAQAVQQDVWRSQGGDHRAANIAAIHAQWQCDAEELWNKGLHSLKAIAERLEAKYDKERKNAPSEDKEEKAKYARSHHTIRKYIRKPQ